MPTFSIKAISLGLVTMLALDLIVGLALLVLWPGGSDDASADASAMYAQPAYLAVALILGTLTTTVGGMVCARRATALPYWNVAAFGALSMVVGLLLSDAIQPVWFTVLASLLTMPAAIWGARIALRKGQDRQA